MSLLRNSKFKVKQSQTFRKTPRLQLHRRHEEREGLMGPRCELQTENRPCHKRKGAG